MSYIFHLEYYKVSFYRNFGITCFELKEGFLLHICTSLYLLGTYYIAKLMLSIGSFYFETFEKNISLYFKFIMMEIAESWRQLGWCNYRQGVKDTRVWDIITHTSGGHCCTYWEIWVYKYIKLGVLLLMLVVVSGWRIQGQFIIFLLRSKLSAWRDFSKSWKTLKSSTQVKLSLAMISFDSIVLSSNQTNKNQYGKVEFCSGFYLQELFL